MPAIRIQGFLGEIPRLSKRLLPDNNAQRAANLKLTSGRLKPFFYPLDIPAVLPTGDVQSVFRMYSGGTDYWLGWTSDVDVAKSPIAGDTTFRTYFTSIAFEPRVTNLAMATAAAAPYPNQWFVLGVTPPVAAPTCTPSGGSGVQESRTYQYTFVTQWGEESAPSPASAVLTGYTNGTWALTLPNVAPPNSYTISAAAWSGGVLTLTVDSTFGLRAGEYATVSGLAPAALNASWKVASVTDGTHFTIAMATPGAITDQTGVATRDAPHNTTGMLKRLYRSVTGSSGTEFYFVKEVAVATTSTNDDVGSNIGEPILTTMWQMPPVDLRGIVAHPSGAMVGFRKNEVWMTEPSAPYAWNPDYRVTTDYDVVAVGVFGSSIVAATEGTPYLISGVDPAAMSPTRIDKPWPCVSKRSMRSMGDAVVWACPLGLAAVGNGGSMLLTEQFFTIDEWRERQPETMFSGEYDGKYFAAYTIAAGTEVLIFDRAREATITRAEADLNGLYSDVSTGNLYFLTGAALKQWDANSAYRLPFTWWSKEFQLPVPVNLAAAKVEADWGVSAAEAAAAQAAQAAQEADNAAAIGANATFGSFNGASVNTWSLNGSAVLAPGFVAPLGARAVVFELFSADALVHSTTIGTDAAFRLPSGEKYDKFSIRLIGDATVYSLLLGESMDALRAA